MIDDLMIAEENFDSLTLLLSDPQSKLDWNLVFTLPAWLKTWWNHFNAGELFLKTIRDKGQILGVAPLYFRDGMVSTIGSVNVCDYQDFIIAPGCENKFYQALLDNLVKNKITRLHVEGLRTDSTIVKHLIPLAKVSGYSVEYHQTDISSDMPLPATWDDYLKMLDGKQRHELKRKIRNLDQTIQTTFRIISDSESLPAATEDFIKLFPESRGDKAEFMTGEIQAFFRSLAIGLTETGVLRYGSLELNGRPIAMVMFFDYKDNFYLYNSAYDPVYRSLSVGLISKAYCIRNAIEQGKKRFDFLKGAEVYKSRLGGQELPLYSCELTF